jgi:hypothetical protein
LQLTVFFHALTMLCSLGSVAFVTLDVRPRARAAIALGFVFGALGARPDRLPDPVWAGGLVALLGTAALLRPQTAFVAAASGGVLAGVWAAMLQAAGVPLVAALTLAFAPMAAAARLAGRSPAFAPALLREEALLVVSLLGLVVAIAPGVGEGWQSAVRLNLQPEGFGSQVVPRWALLFVGGACGLGSLYTVWMRR